MPSLPSSSCAFRISVSVTSIAMPFVSFKALNALIASIGEPQAMAVAIVLGFLMNGNPFFLLYAWTTGLQPLALTPTKIGSFSIHPTSLSSLVALLLLAYGVALPLCS